MRISLSIAALAFAISGCVVTTTAPPQQPQTYAPQPGPLRIAGPWQLLNDSGRSIRRVSVERVKGGIVVENGRGERHFAKRIGRGVFEDKRGRIYEFFSADQAVFTNPNKNGSLIAAMSSGITICPFGVMVLSEVA